MGRDDDAGTSALQPRGRGVRRGPGTGRGDAAAALHRRPAAPPTRPTARTIRPSGRAVAGPWPRRRPRCISTRRCSTRCAARGVGLQPCHAACRCRHLSAGQGGRRARSTGCMPNGARSPTAAAREIAATRAAGGRIIPVGTTALRLIESAAAPAGPSRPSAAETDIFITPGYRFRADRRADDELSPAALDADDAGLGADGRGADARRL